MKENRERVLLYLLELIDKDDPDYAKKTAEYFSVAISTVYYNVKQLVKSKDLIEDKKKKSGYSLPIKNYSFSYSTEKTLSESRIFQSDIEPLLSDFPRNVRDIWIYCFTEMMNNAIEHSEAEKITCFVKINRLKTAILIYDDGIGIFRKIKNFLLETTGEDIPERECPGYLLAGRFTTAKEHHSGEGVFFTSHMLDHFLIMSSGIAFARNDFSDKQIDLKIKQKKGTAVYMVLSNHSKKTSEEVFNRFTDEENGFNKTEIPLAHLFPNGYPVSRSEARRLFGMIRKFQEVTLDFSGIENVGQAFVHEFFIILSPKEPNQSINLKGISAKVNAMISRVKNTV